MFGLPENRQYFGQYLTRTRSILLSIPPSIDSIIERVRSAIKYIRKKIGTTSITLIIIINVVFLKLFLLLFRFLSENGSDGNLMQFVPVYCGHIRDSSVSVCAADVLFGFSTSRRHCQKSTQSF